MNPRIAITASAYRPQNWMDLYRSIGENDVEFELVFVGPNPPNYELPKNFRFIRTDVKPIQCMEIAARNATADLIIVNFTDDCEFVGSRPLDRLYETYKSHNQGKVILSCKYMLDGEDLSHALQRFDTTDPSSPVMPLAALMSRKLYRDIGGMDRNFKAVYGDLDITMRVYALGGRVVMSDVYINELLSKRWGSILCGEFGEHDRGILNSLWTTNGQVHFNRAKPVEPFSDVNILEASQGPRGRWRGNRPILIEKIEDNILSQRSIPRRIIRGIRKPSMYFSYAKRIALYTKKTIFFGR